MTPLWTFEALVAAMDGRPVGAPPAGITGISIDSRTLQPGEAFFAIVGEKFDGHDFATAAVKAGASILVVAEGRLPALGRINAPMIVVPDVLAALEKAGVAARARSKARIIAVTGSVGKTTTKEMLRHVLSTVGKVHASDKSFNNHWGVPLTLARLPADADYAVFEIGMNHPGEIRPLVGMVRPHIAIVTLIAAAHLGHFRNLEEIAMAKAEIFEGVEPDGHVILNRDDTRFKLLDKVARQCGIDHVWGFGEHARSTFRLTGWAPSGDGSDMAMKIGGEEFSVHLGAAGRHIAQNALAVLGAAYLAGADPAQVAPALAALTPERGRGRRYRLLHPDGDILLIDESYNANPASMKAAIELLATAEPGEGGRRIAVLGDMLELGQYSAKLHAAMAELLTGWPIDMAFLAGPEMKALADKLPESFAVEYQPDSEALAPIVLDSLRPGDVVMVKSSNGAGFSKIVDALVLRYPAATSAPVVPTETRGDN